MKIKTLLFVLAISVSSVIGQSLGVGTATPNANAALHVESPTNNQGFIMPRLTTAQRNALGSILVAGDNGLMLYDTEVKGIFIWSGTAWITATSGSSGPKLQYPYEDVVTTPTGTPDLLALRYNNPENKRVLRLENLSGTNGSSTLSVLNQGVGIAGYFQTQNTAATSSTIYATTNSDAGAALYTRNEGLGSAASFEITLSGNAASGVYAKTLGTGAAVLADNQGNGFGVHGKSAGINFATAAVYGEHTGTGDAAGAFRINNAGNTYSALYGETNGTGPAVYGMQIGNSSSSAGYFQQGDATRTTGTGPAVFGAQLGLGRAGQFQIGNAANAEAALRSFTNGTGRAGFFTISNAANPSEAIFATTNGTGSAGNFTITNASNPNPALNVETNGTGFGVKSVSTGPEVAGYFQTSNPSSIASTLFSLTDAPGGVGVGTINTANGLALGIFQGGMKVSTHTLSAGTTITIRAIAYNITGGGPYTFSLTPGLTDGEMFFFYNTTGAPVTVAGAAIPASSGLLFIVLGGVPRPF